MSAMITFSVVKEQHGWAVRMGQKMTTPFWSKSLAIREANNLARAIRCHGECVEVIVDDHEAEERSWSPTAPTRSQADIRRHGGQP